jgi:hypothetical protein
MEEGDTCPDRARLASCPEAMDCSDPRHHEAASPGGKHLGVSVELTTDDLRDIDTAASKITVQGVRYPEKLLLDNHFPRWSYVKGAELAASPSANTSDCQGGG